MNLGVCAILWVGGIQVNVGELTQGQVMALSLIHILLTGLTAPRPKAP